jgi:hypothetical protein
MTSAWPLKDDDGVNNFFLSYFCLLPFFLHSFHVWGSFALSTSELILKLSVLRLSIRRLIGGISHWQGLNLRRKTTEMNTDTTYMPRMEFEPRFPVFEKSRFVRTLYRAASVVSWFLIIIIINIVLLLRECNLNWIIIINHHRRHWDLSFIRRWVLWLSFSGMWYRVAWETSRNVPAKRW